MVPKKMRFAIAMWPEGQEGSPPRLMTTFEINQPGAGALESALAALGVNSDASQIQQAFRYGLNQVDVISVLPEAEMPSGPLPAPAEPIVPEAIMPEQPSKEVFDTAYAALSDEDKALVDSGAARINVAGELEHLPPPT